jgi:hypothetical protein
MEVVAALGDDDVDMEANAIVPVDEDTAYAVATVRVSPRCPTHSSARCPTHSRAWSDPHAVEHAMAEGDQHLVDGKAACAPRCLNSVALTLSTWISSNARVRVWLCCALVVDTVLLSTQCSCQLSTQSCCPRGSAVATVLLSPQCCCRHSADVATVLCAQ